MTSDRAGDTQALMQAAVAAHQRGDFAAAEIRYREVLRRAPAHADATHFLGLVAHQTGHRDAALKLLTQAVVLGPESALYRHNLGGVLREQGRYAEAERSYREALALKPEYPDALLGLAMTQTACRRLEDALTAYDGVLALDRGHFEAWMGRGAVLQELVRRQDMLDAYREARTLAAGDADKLQRLGLAWRDAGMAAEARACFEQALGLRPDFVEAHNSLGITLADLGELAAAETHYREALRLRPAYAGGWHNFTGMARLTPDDLLWASLQEYAEKLPRLPAEEASMLHFSLGKVRDDLGEYTRAFEHYLEANRLKRAGIEYDEARQARFFRDFIRYCNAEFLRAHAGTGAASELPVFIVGMSRSGTTLVEQILGSHPEVHGAGELHFLRRCLRVELGPTDSDDELPARLASLDAAGLRRVGERYAAALAELAPAARRITDKLPGNMALVGLIHLTLPRARIIHCVREPLDTCVSCFSKLFTTGHAFSYDLRELGRFYRLYQELMHHWQTVLPLGRMLEVRYEDVVADMEGQARRLLEFCGLPWNAACLRFHENRRTVRTASLAQVRQPIYSGSVGRWRRYEKYLAPLQEALAGD